MCLKNWRAVLAILVTVVPTFPGLVNSINPSITIGYASHLFDIAWMYGVRYESLLVFCVRSPNLLLTPQFVVSCVVYYTTSVLFPARVTFVEKLISADDAGVDYDQGSPAKSDTFSGKGEDLEKQDVKVVVEGK